MVLFDEVFVRAGFRGFEIMALMPLDGEALYGFYLVRKAVGISWSDQRTAVR